MKFPVRNFKAIHSSPVLSKTIDYDSIMDLVIHICLEDFDDTITPPSVKIYPLVDFRSLVLDIQLASLYPTSTSK